MFWHLNSLLWTFYKWYSLHVPLKNPSIFLPEAQIQDGCWRHLDTILKINLQTRTPKIMYKGTFYVIQPQGFRFWHQVDVMTSFDIKKSKMAAIQQWNVTFEWDNVLGRMGGSPCLMVLYGVTVTVCISDAFSVSVCDTILGPLMVTCSSWWFVL